MTTWLALIGATLIAASGLLALCVRRGPQLADRAAAASLAAGAVTALAGSVLALWNGGDSLLFEAGFPGGDLRLGLDALSALFLLPVAVLTAACGTYALAYFPAAAHPREAARLRVSFGLSSGGMILVLLARHSLVFLAGWEIMAIAAFFAVTADDRDAEVRDAGFLYLVSTRASTLCLVALFALHRVATGSFDLVPIGAGAVPPAIQSALFVLALTGFGLKAGLVPLHYWLPPAHAAAPTHVSALLSGVLIKVGIYGIVRVVSLVPDTPPWWGESLLVIGVVSAVLGVAFALAQHDVKRLLAYHSVENIGIIAIGLGAALIARAAGHWQTAALALAGSLLHVANHALFKGLLFLGAGAVVQRTGTRSLDALGGIANAMPVTALLFLVGAVSIVGLPPLNGFVSEFLVYSGLLRVAIAADGGPWLLAALAAPALALVGGLALASFAKVVGSVFLGAPRHASRVEGGDAPGPMLAPMAGLAATCAAIGIAPFALAPALAAACAVALGRPEAPLAAPFGALSLVALATLALCALLALALRARLRRAPLAAGLTWDCGYAAPSARMQYSASSFAEPLVRAFSFALLPRTRAPRLAAVFPGSGAFHSEVVDAVLDRLLVPAARAFADAAGRLRALQRGSVHAYLLYVWLALFALLAVTGMSR
ncbi:MAG TPA: proton-conducting transporter membrane subunit [Myxococcota bacterium]|nr:proton-conducting transporter membrane subunit [Myxococcota bacterium]